MSIFNSIRIKRPNRSVFDLSHEVKMSMKMGKLVPFFCQDVVPGDTFNMNTEIMMRLAPMISPVMHRVNVFTHFFYVPNRLIWDEWEDFITGGENGHSMPVFPYFLPSSAVRPLMGKGSLSDYLGFPTPSSSDTVYPPDFRMSLLPFRAYQLIYNEFYRDQNLTPPVEFLKTSGSTSLQDVRNLFQLQSRCWEKDYFTSALPFTQKGGDVHLPIAGQAPVYYDGSSQNNAILRNHATGAVLPTGNVFNANGELAVEQSPTQIWGANYDPQGTLKADMSSVTAVTVNEFRQANRLQQWLERNARGGSRYIEQILSHFGVRSSDARLQRPEFLGGGKAPVTISEVLQTSSSDDTSPQANMSGHGVSVGNSNRFKKFFEEHGQVFGIVSVLPRTTYQQGVPRQYMKFDKFDYYFPEFAHLGEQPVFESELCMHDNVGPDEVFGYQSRYAEYKYIPSAVRGDFRDNLNFWHMGRTFADKPRLNHDFVTSDPTKRIFAVTDSSQDELYVQLYNNLQAVRPMPKYGTPSL